MCETSMDMKKSENKKRYPKLKYTRKVLFEKFSKGTVVEEILFEEIEKCSEIKHVKFIGANDIYYQFIRNYNLRISIRVINKMVVEFNMQNDLYNSIYVFEYNYHSVEKSTKNTLNKILSF